MYFPVHLINRNVGVILNKYLILKTFPYVTKIASFKIIGRKSLSTLFKHTTLMCNNGNLANNLTAVNLEIRRSAFWAHTIQSFPRKVGFFIIKKGIIFNVL